MRLSPHTAQASAKAPFGTRQHRSDNLVLCLFRRASKYCFHVGSCGFAIPLILICRLIGVSASSTKLCILCLLLSSTAVNIQSLSPLVLKYFAFTHRADLCGCRRLAHCQSAGQTWESIQLKVFFATMCRWAPLTEQRVRFIGHFIYTTSRRTTSMNSNRLYWAILAFDSVLYTPIQFSVFVKRSQWPRCHTESILVERLLDIGIVESIKRLFKIIRIYS